MRANVAIFLFASVVAAPSALRAAELEPPSLPVTGGAWTAHGPAHAINGQVEGTSGGTPSMPTEPVTGAIQAVVAHPTDANTLWVGVVGGGIWKTTNATSASPTWTSQTDGFASLAIGAMDRDPTDGTHGTLVAGVGRFTSFGQANGGRVGILRTTNGGTNWTLLGNSTLAGRNISGVAPRGATIVVSVNVADSFTCSNIGIWRSTDTGATFTRISANSGTGTGLPLGRAFDLASDPTNNAILYTSIRDTPGCNTNALSVNGVYKSTDTGATWTRVSDATMNALVNPDSSAVSNIRMTVGNSGEVYAAIVVSGRLAGLFRSGNGGASWTQLDTPTTTEGATPHGIHVGGQGSIHLSLRADPTNANIVYIGGDRQPGFGDPGATFPNSLGAIDYSGRLFRVNAALGSGSQASTLTHCSSVSAGCPAISTTSRSAPHADSRRMVFNASNELVETDDGGIYRRTNPQGLGDWFSLIGNLAGTEQHDVAYDRVSNMIISGNQDTGTTEQTTVGGTTWTSYTTGDGGDVQVDDIASGSQSIRYSSFQNWGNPRRRTKNTSGVTTADNPILGQVGASPAFVAQFVTPIELNTITPTRLLAAGSNGLYESFDRGDNITQILATAGNAVIAMVYGGTSSATPNADLIYALRSGQSIVYVRTSGSGPPVATATNPGTSSLRDIAVDPDDWQRAYVVNSNNQVFETTNAGANWTDRTGNLATGMSDLRSIVYVPGSPDSVVVGGQPCLPPCAAGGPVHRMAVNNPGVWEQLGTGLPNSTVWDMDYDPVDDVLVAGTLGRGAWTLTSPNGPAATLSIDDVTVLEGNAGTVNATFTVTLSAAVNASVSFTTANNTATAGSDYGSNSGTLNFTGGDTSETITVVVNGDLVDEANETFFVNLSGASGASISDGQGVGTITDDDTATIGVSDPTVAESAGTMSFTVTLSTPSAQTVTVSYATANNTATAGSDYTATSGTVTFVPGDISEPVSVTITSDNVDEANETLFLNLSSPSGATIADSQGLGTITDDDTSTLSVSDVSVVEGVGSSRPATFTVTLSTPSSFVVGVSFATANDTATAGSDYASTSGSLSFAAGEVSKTVDVTVLGDITVEANETFFLNLSAPSNATITDGQGIGTILNDDPPSAAALADYLHLGTSRLVTTTLAVSERWFKVRLQPGRSYSAAAWAPLTDVSEQSVTLSLQWFLDDGTSAPASTSATAVEPRPVVTDHTGATASIIPTSAECPTSTGCTYRLRLTAGTTTTLDTRLLVVETTMVSAYWQVATSAGFDAAPQVRNNTSSSLSVTFTAYNASGGVVCSNAFAVPANGMTTFGISGVSPGCSIAFGFGSASLAYHGPPGALTANITTFSGVSGLSFDAPFRPRNTWTGLKRGPN